MHKATNYKFLRIYESRLRFKILNLEFIWKLVIGN